MLKGAVVDKKPILLFGLACTGNSLDLVALSKVGHLEQELLAEWYLIPVMNVLVSAS